MNSSPIALMGIDLGTSGTKTVIVDVEGNLLANALYDYSINAPQPGWAEQNSETWYRAALTTMSQALRQSGLAAESIVAISLGGQMHTTVCLDKKGKALRPAILWADQRSRQQVDQVYRQLGTEKLYAWTGNPLATGFMLASWLWLRENEPDLCRSTATLLLPKDYLRYRLTGVLGSEPSDAASTLLFDPVHWKWSEPLLSALQIDPGLLPDIHDSWEIAGGLLSEVAEATGLRSGTPVIYGGSDQALQSLAQGVIEPGLISCTIGTGGQLFSSTLKPLPDPALRIHFFCHVLPQVWHLEAATLAAGLSLKWLRDNVVTGQDYQSLANMASQIAAGAEGLLFLPYLAGERTPLMDPNARAAFVGLTLRHDRRHMARAVMEGVVFGLRQGLDLMIEMGTPLERILASGGATRHPLWLQLQADIFQRPVYASSTQEATARGAALLAGVGAKVYEDSRDACKQTVRQIGNPVLPQPENARLYEDIYQTYCQIYPSLKNTGI
ncbi:MAG: xylulokinase [Anaerolineaceae bacterium]|nr:xylulokinase [Anaerolineaceae bacterium]